MGCGPPCIAARAATAATYCCRSRRHCRGWRAVAAAATVQKRADVRSGGSRRGQRGRSSSSARASPGPGRGVGRAVAPPTPPSHRPCRPMHRPLPHHRAQAVSQREDDTKGMVGLQAEVRIRGRAIVRVCYPSPALCVRLERRVQLAGATPRLAAPLGVVVRDEVPVQDCSIVRVLDLRP